MTEFRTERDSMGEISIPAQVYYGAQTQRAVENFPISGRTIPAELIHALGLVKWAAAAANRDLGLFGEKSRRPLSEKQIESLLAACLEVSEGRFDGQFPVDVFQTGSGTSSNMNANEVIANRAVELSGGDRFAIEKPIHPNDHVNMGQSTNDMFPTAIHVAMAKSIEEQLVPALSWTATLLSEKASKWETILKIGRTHLADATPMTLGQEIGGLARQMQLAADRAEPFAVLAIDIDHFKAYNDHYGHQAGDACLQAVAAVNPGGKLAQMTVQYRRPSDELHYRLGRVLNSLEAGLPALEELTTPQELPLVESWRQGR